MSGRTVPRFVPVGLLAVALAAPAVAQEGGFQVPLNSDPIPTLHPVAPMPRAKDSPRLRDVYGTRTGAAEEPEAWYPTPVNTPYRTKIKINHDINDQSNDGFPVPISSDPIIPIPGSDTLFFNGSEFVRESSRTERHVAPALVIGTRGLERAAPTAGVPQLAPCQHVRANTDIFVIRIGEGVESSAARHDEPLLPQCDSMTWTFPIQNVVKYQYEGKTVEVAPFASTKTPLPVNALSGTWYRELPGTVLSATFANDELKLCMVQAADGSTATFTLTAHYTLTKDGLVYGAVTGTDADVKQGAVKIAPVSSELAELSMMLQAFVDAPFSFRTKMTSAGLMVSSVKCGVLLDRIEANPFGGMFKLAKDGRVPAPVPLNTGAGKTDVSLGAVIGPIVDPAAGSTIGNVVDKPVPAPQAGTNPPDCQRVGIDFNCNPPVMIPPKPIGGACTLPSPVVPPAAVGTPLRPACDTAVPDTMKSLVSEAFGQMLRQSGGSCVGEGMTLPTPRYLEHYPQYFPPDPAFPLPRELAKQEEAESAVRRAGATTAAPMIPIASTEPPAKRGVVGTWYRDVAGKQCVVKVSPDHLTLTVHEAVEEDGKVSTASLIFTADYHMARDGVTAVGLITSVDVSFEGDFPQEDAKPFFEMLGELQKVLEDKPFALTFRPYGDALVIGNVRMPTVSDRMDVQPGGYMAGRYKSAGDKLPKPKPTKMTDPALRQMPGAPTAVPSLAIPPASAYPQPYTPPGGVCPQPYSVPLPGGGYPQPYSTPPALNGDLLPPQSLPAPRIVPSSGSQPATPSAPQSNPPLMKQPIPPDLSSLEKKKPVATEMAIGWQNRIASLPDPVRNGRMSPGITGQLFLFGGTKLEFAPVDGTLTVDLVDETPRQPGQPAAKPERWQFSKEILRNLQTHDETFGKSYVLFLPWPAYTPDVTRVRISVRYDPDNGHTLFLTPNNVTFDTSTSRGTPAQTDKAKETAMSQPVKPAMMGLTEVPQQPTPNKTPKAAPKIVILGFNLELESYAGNPNIRIQELLYQSEDLRHLRNEWRRFWFNDHPSHLTPERVHGGIY